ncbi:MAG TPA: hypothetical protein VG826_20510 [Pirellulales bacterium]|nr:hypothetical protein [Pirellulales bacterium]
MADSFDPYHKWLGISPKDQPPNHYRLLAIELFESDPDVIEGAADRVMAHLRTFQAGPNSAHSQKLLNECAAARVTLLDPQKRAEYDRQLREKLAASAGFPIPAGEGRGDGTSPRSRAQPAAQPQPARSPQPVPIARPLLQAAPMPTAEVVPLNIVDEEDAPTPVRRRVNRKMPLWRQPAVLGAAGALVIFGAIAYALTRSGKLPTDGVTNATLNRDSTAPSPTSVPDKPTSPKTDKSSPGPAIAPPVQVSSPADFEILAATWGADDKWVEVTDGVRSLVKEHRLMMNVWSNLFGSPADPAPGVGKKLRLRYRSRGKEYTAEYFDYWFVYLDGNPPAAPTDSGDALELLEARYGAGGTFLDVLPQLAPHVAGGRLSVAADEFAASTAAELEKHGIGPEAIKVLWVRYRNETGEHFDYAWNPRLLTIDTRLPATAGHSVDLLRLIEVPRHSVYGDWSLADGKLLAPAQVAARVQIPYRVASDYALKVVVESDGKLAEVTAGLVVGGHQVLATIDSGGDSSFSGMAHISRLWHSDDNNPSKTWRLACMLEQGRSNTLTYLVHPTSVRILRDGAEVVRWSGDAATFSIPDTWEVPDPRRLYLQSYNVPYRITQVELTPLAPESAPMLTLDESGLPVDVLKSIDLERDRVHGEWQYDGHALVSPADDFRSRLQVPAIVPESYQLDIVAQRESGNDCLALMVPVAGAQGTLIIDGHGGTLAGLQMIDGQMIDANETRRETSVFADGKRHLARLTVQKNHVRLLCDGKPIVDWSGDVSRLNSFEPLPPYNDRIYLGTWHSRYRLTQIKLRSLRGDAPDETPTKLAGEPTDFLKQINVKRDTVSGKWSLNDGMLTSPAEEFTCLALPSPPAGEYRLTVDLQRLQGIDTFSVGLPIGKHQVIAAIDAWDGKFSGLERIDGKSCYENESARAGHLLEPGRRYTLSYTVRANQVRVEVDGVAVIDWSGDPARLSTIDVFKSPDPTRLVLGTAHNSVFRISKLEITSLGSPAAPPRTLAPLAEPNPPVVNPPERKFSDLASDKETRLPVPDDDAQKEARKEMQKKLGNSLKGAKTPDQKRSLAQDLAQKPVGEDKAYAYVVLKQAIDLAEAAGELELAWQIADQLARTFAVDGMALRNQSLAEIGKAAKSPDAAWLLTDAACHLMTTALLAGDAAAVKKAGAQAQTFAKRINDRVLQKDVNGRANDAGKLAGELEAVAAARKKLKAAPDDPQANFTVGHFDLCAAGDFDTALPKLAKGSDEGWKKLAADELGLVNRQGGSRVIVNGRQVLSGDPADAQRELAVADSWWARADEEPWPAKHHLRMRAAQGYQAAYRSLVDAGRVRAAERLRMLLAIDDGFPHWELFSLRGLPSGRLDSDVVRIEGGRGGLETAVDYAGALDVTVVVRTTGSEFGLSSHNLSWGWKFQLSPNQWHTVRFVLTPIARTAFVDGLPVDTDAWETPRKFNAAPVYVYMNKDDVAEIRRFIIRATD